MFGAAARTKRTCVRSSLGAVHRCSPFAGGVVSLPSTSVRRHSGHSHHHGHSHSLVESLVGTPHQHTEHLEPLFKSGQEGQGDRGQRITLLGFASNVALAAIKAMAGIHFHSEALVADAGHSVSDILSDVVTFSTIYLGTLSPSPRFPHGRAALDSIGGLTVSGLLFSGSLAMGWHSLQGIMALQEHAHGDELLSGAALAVAAGTILSKEALFRYTLREARRTGQTVLVASAWHHRSDSLCTAVALMGIGGSLLTGLHWVDPLAGLLVSGIILRASVANSIRPIQGLLNYAPRLSDALTHTLDDALQTAPSTDILHIQDRFLQVHGGRMDLHLRASVERTFHPWAEVQAKQDALEKYVQEKLDEKMDEVPEGKLKVHLQTVAPS